MNKASACLKAKRPNGEDPGHTSALRKEGVDKEIMKCQRGRQATIYTLRYFDTLTRLRKKKEPDLYQIALLLLTKESGTTRAICRIPRRCPQKHDRGSSAFSEFDSGWAAHEEYG